MNQILLTKEESGISSAEMKSIIRFFVVSIIVFALILIGEGAFNLYNKSKTDSSFPAPVVSSEKNGSSITLNIDSETRINKIIYVWDNGIENVYEANGKIDFNFDIDIPPGEHVLKVTIIDVEGNKTKYENMSVAFTEEDDAVKPTISIEKKNGKLEIVATDDTELDYFSYKWEDSDEVVLEPSEDDKTTIKTSIDVLEGTKKITLVAMDKSGNKKTEARKIIGSNGPSITASIADNSFVVKVTDEVEITKIVYTHNEEETTIDDIPDGTKEYEFKVPLKDGENYLKVNAYENSIMAEYKCKKTRR
ncbi:MAG: hypothetical protein IKD76_05930 [Clostridia bacterium]|nr:hypothetical protein [Clostridia bacterium]